jgi:large subunit ribosomal protein L23
MAKITKVKKEEKITKKKVEEKIPEGVIYSGKSEQILVEPWVTEKTTNLNMENKYVFRVLKSADKKTIAQAINHVFKVIPVSVKVINIKSKKRVRGRTIGKKPGYKKAIVTLKEGEKIELFKGV